MRAAGAASPNIPTVHHLSRDHVQVYVWILERQPVTKGRCVAAASELGLTGEGAGCVLDELTALGLLHSGGMDDPLVPLDPELAAGALATRLRADMLAQQQRLTQIEVEFGRLRERFLEHRPQRGESIEVIPDVADVRAALNVASAECREDVLSSQPGGVRPREVLEEALTRDTELLTRGVRMRTLYHHTARFNAPSQAYVSVMTGLGAEYRTSHEPFGRLIVFDQALAVIPGEPGTLEAVLVRDRAVVSYLRSIFESAWAYARPFSEAAADGLEEVARELNGSIVRLLAAGCKDDTISRRLGMSLRTTRKHVAAIMESLGAVSRFQAGVLAARAGLLTEDDGAPAGPGGAGPAPSPGDALA